MMQIREGRTPQAVEEASARPYPLCVTYDGKAFIDSDYGTGKGAQLRTLLGRFGPSFTGLAPTGTANTSMPIVQRGDSSYLVWQQTTLPSLLAELKPDIFLAPYNTAPLRIPAPIKLISVVHDLILFESFPDARLKRRLIDRYRGVLLRHTIQRSSLILTVSHFTANEIRKRFPNTSPRVINCTVPSSWYVRDQVVPIDERGRYILIVTSNVAHKNIPRALEAFARYKALDPDSDIKLRMVGVASSSAYIGALAEKLGVRDAILIEPFLSPEALQDLYRRALCVLLPSRMEGFGIPALEAMSSGTPLVSSNTWSLPEVGGDAPLYFDPTNVQEMANALLRVCTDASLRARLMQQGLERAEVFHPDLVQGEVEEFWRELPELYKSWKQ